MQKLLGGKTAPSLDLIHTQLGATAPNEPQTLMHLYHLH